MLWRRFVVSSKCTLADLHFVLQIGFGWTDFHLHRFRKKDYAVPRLCGIACAHTAREVKLADLHFRTNERFLYEYNFGDLWQLQVRIEERSAIEPRRPYPVCAAGCWAGPPEGSASATPTPNLRVQVMPGGTPPLASHAPSVGPFEQEVTSLEDRRIEFSRRPIIFYGSSSIRLWKTLSQDFIGYPVVNCGFGGSRHS
jgi:hypothetical protein